MSENKKSSRVTNKKLSQITNKKASQITDPKPILDTDTNKNPILNTSPKKKYTCIHCKEVFSSERAMVRHVRTICQPAKITSKCHKCNKSYPRYDKLLEHQKKSKRCGITKIIHGGITINTINGPVTIAHNNNEGTIIINNEEKNNKTSEFENKKPEMRNVVEKNDPIETKNEPEEIKNNVWKMDISKMNEFGKNELNDITENDIDLFFNNGSNFIINMLLHTNLNVFRPEFHNVYLPCISSKKTHIFQEGRWKVIRNYVVFDNIVETKIQNAKMLTEKYNDLLTDEKKEEIVKLMNSMMGLNARKEMRNSIYDTLYEKKHIVKPTYDYVKSITNNDRKLCNEANVSATLNYLNHLGLLAKINISDDDNK